MEGIVEIMWFCYRNICIFNSWDMHPHRSHVWFLFWYIFIVKLDRKVNSDVSSGFSEVQNTSGVLSILFRCSNPVTSPSMNSEALQVIIQIIKIKLLLLLLCSRCAITCFYCYSYAQFDQDFRIWKLKTARL